MEKVTLQLPKEKEKMTTEIAESYIESVKKAIDNIAQSGKKKLSFEAIYYVENDGEKDVLIEMKSDILASDLSGELQLMVSSYSDDEN